MAYRKINCILEGDDNDLSVEICLSEKAKIPESAINKALMITMNYLNYLIENLETTYQEEP